MSRHFKGKYYSSKRRAVYARGDHIEHIVLFEMYNWTCCICGEQINKFIRFPNMLAASVEHIIPISKGGTHTWDNVAPSHIRCNQAKGDQIAM